jgi:hypothetical protein
VDGPWWGDYSIDDGSTSHWQLGSRSLHIQRNEDELTVFSTLDETAPQVTRYTANAEAHATEPIARCVGVALPVTLTPVLLDRTVVARPVSPVSIAPGQTAVFYLSSPVLIELQTKARQLLRLESAPVRKTWIGASPRDGEVGYALRSSARTLRSRIVDHPTRAISRVDVQNAGDEVLKLERVHLPMRQLSLYASKTHELWTAAMSLRLQGAVVVEAKVHTKAPDDAGQAVLLQPAVEPVDKGTLRRMFGALLGAGKGAS